MMSIIKIVADINEVSAWSYKDSLKIPQNQLRVRFFIKIQIRILESKNGFHVSLLMDYEWIMNLENPLSEWIH